MRWETFKLWHLVWLILEVWRYIPSLFLLYYVHDLDMELCMIATYCMWKQWQWQWNKLLLTKKSIIVPLLVNRMIFCTAINSLAPGKLADSHFISIILTHCGRAMHMCVSKLTIIGLGNGLLPGRCQAITSTNNGILLNRTLGTNFSDILCEIHSFKKMYLKMFSAKWQQFCLSSMC